MPFKSEAQRRFMFAAEKRGDLPEGTAERWQEHTPKGKKLPEHVKQAGLEKIADSLAPAISIQTRTTGTKTQRWSTKDEKDSDTPTVKKPWKDSDLTRSRYDGPASEVVDKSV